MPSQAVSKCWPNLNRADRKENVRYILSFQTQIKQETCEVLRLWEVWQGGSVGQREVAELILRTESLFLLTSSHRHYFYSLGKSRFSHIGFNQNNDLFYFTSFGWRLLEKHPPASLENNLLVLWCYWIPSAAFMADMVTKRKFVFRQLHLWLSRSTILIYKFKFCKSCAFCKNTHRNPATHWRHKIFTCQRKGGLGSGRGPETGEILFPKGRRVFLTASKAGNP